MDSPERLAEAAWIHKLGPEAETLFTKGSEPEPFVRSAVVDPIVSSAARRAERRSGGPRRGGQALAGALAAPLGGVERRGAAHPRLRRARGASALVAGVLHHHAALDRRVVLRGQSGEPHRHDAAPRQEAGDRPLRVGAHGHGRVAGPWRQPRPRRPARLRGHPSAPAYGGHGDAGRLGAAPRAQGRLRRAVRGGRNRRAQRLRVAGHRRARAGASRRRRPHRGRSHRRGLRTGRASLRRRSPHLAPRCACCAARSQAPAAAPV